MEELSYISSIFHLSQLVQAFFYNIITDHQVSNRFFKELVFLSQISYFIRGSFSGSISRKPFLACFQELFIPPVELRLMNTLFPTKFCYRAFSAYGFHNNEDLLFGREYPPGFVADVPYKVFCS